MPTFSSARYSSGCCSLVTLWAPDAAAIIAPGREPRDDAVDDRDDADEPGHARLVGEVDGGREDAHQDREAEQHEGRAHPVRADLLLQRHVTPMTATGARSPSSSSRKNSRGRKPKVPGDQAGGERLLRGVVGLHHGVVVPARGGDLVLGVGQLVLQPLEVLAGAQLRVGLGDGEQPAQRRARLAGRIGRAGHPLRRQRAGPGLGQLLEQARLVRRVGLDRLHQVRDQVGAPLQLDVDPREALVGLVAQPHQPVVGVHQPQQHQHDQHDDHDHDDHGQKPTGPARLQWDTRNG